MTGRWMWSLGLTALLASTGCDWSEQDEAPKEAPKAAPVEDNSHLPIIEAKIDDEPPRALPGQAKAAAEPVGLARGGAGAAARSGDAPVIAAGPGGGDGQALGELFGGEGKSGGLGSKGGGLGVKAAAPAEAGDMAEAMPPPRPDGFGPGNGRHLMDGDPLAGYRGRVHVVDPNGGGDHRNLEAAVKQAAGGDRIEVRPGTYTLPLTLERPVAIIGQGRRSDIVIEVGGANIIVNKAVRALLKNLTLRQTGGEPARYGIDVQSGRLVVQACDVTSASLAALTVRQRGQLEIVDSRIHDSAQSGVFAYEGGEVTVIASDVVGNGKAGIEIKGTGKGRVQRSYFYDGGASGVFVHEGGTARVEESYFTRNRLAGLEAKNGGVATVCGNQFIDGNQSGMFFNTGARGTIEDNTVRGNGLAGLEVKSGADPEVRRNRFMGGTQSGIFINTGARGTYEDNTITGQGLAGIEVKGAEPVLRRNTVRDNKQSGVYVHSNAKGLFESNTVAGNGKAGFEINEGATPTLRGNVISRNGYQGVWVLDAGGGTFEGNRFDNNVKGPARLDGNAATRVSGDLPGALGGRPGAPARKDAPSALDKMIEGTGK